MAYKMDFANSYEQKSWESALRMHKMYTKFIEESKNTPIFNDTQLKLRERWLSELKKLESKYPHLRSNDFIPR